MALRPASAMGAIKTTQLFYVVLVIFVLAVTSVAWSALSTLNSLQDATDELGVDPDPMLALVRG
ncbi:MAG: hypothetical protein AAFO29_20150, partial [Actinomycetota bacterium]